MHLHSQNLIIFVNFSNSLYPTHLNNNNYLKIKQKLTRIDQYRGG